MKYIVATGVSAAAIVFVVNWGEVLFYHLLIRSVLVGIGFILALTAAKKAVATFVLGTTSPATDTSGTRGVQDANPPASPAEESGEDGAMDVSGETGSGSDPTSGSEEGEGMEPDQIAEMISGQMSGEEG